MMTSVLPPSPAASTRSGSRPASAPKTTSTMRKPVTPRIDEAAGITHVDHRARRRDDRERPEHARGVRASAPAASTRTHSATTEAVNDSVLLSAPAHLRVGAGEVGGERVARDGERHLNLHGRAAARRRCPCSRRSVDAAVGPGCDLGAHQALGVVDQVGGARAQRYRPRSAGRCRGWRARRCGRRPAARGDRRASWSGTRTLARSSVKIASSGSPRRYSFSQGMRRPS